MRFIEERVVDLSRFDRPIKRQKIAIFATETGLRKLKSKDGKVVAACHLRDLFGKVRKGKVNTTSEEHSHSSLQLIYRRL